MRSLLPIACASLHLNGCAALHPEAANAWQRFKRVEKGIVQRASARSRGGERERRGLLGVLGCRCLGGAEYAVRDAHRHV
jgi:hypothetical protein